MKKLYLSTILLVAAATSTAQVSTGVVTGQLRGSDGTPAVGVRIAAAEVQARSEQRDLVSIGRTDGQGRYRLEAVPPGQYWIVAGSTTSPTYYPGVEQSAFAKTVNVTAGTTVGNIDFAIVAALNAMTNDASGRAGNGRRPQIKGQFVIEGGGELPTPFGDFHVWYDSLAPAVAEDGTFALPLSPKAEFVTVAIYSNRLIGDYYIKAMSYGSLDLLKNPLIITGTASAVDITLAPGNRVSGNIRTADGAPVEMTAFLIPIVRTPERPDLLRLMVTNREGRFEIFGVAPGEYRLTSANDNDLNRESPIVTIPGDVLDIQLLLGPDRGLRRVP